MATAYPDALPSCGAVAAALAAVARRPVVPEILATWYAKIITDNHEQHIHPPLEVVYHLMVGPTGQPPPLVRKPSTDMSNVHLFSDSLAFCY